jgi:hypothetical protein
MVVTCEIVNDASMPNIEASFESLSQIPHMLGDVRAGVGMLNALSSAPAAVAATGSWPASTAMTVFSGAIAYFLADLVKCLDKDIEGIIGVQKNYQKNEERVTQIASRGQQLIDNAAKAERPRLESSGRYYALPASSSVR